MNEGSFSISIKESVELFKYYDLLQKENFFNTRMLSSSKYYCFIEKCRESNYPEYYRYALENDCYDLLLKDNSFLQFTYDNKDRSEIIRLAYYPTICQISYQEFLEMNEFSVDEDEDGDTLIDEYQQFLIEQIPENTTPLRYDFDKKLYKEIVHSSSHIHFGNAEDVRIPLNCIIKPALFSKFVIEYYFFKKWKEKIELKDYDNALYKSSEYELINSELFTEKDKMLPYIFLK